MSIQAYSSEYLLIRNTYLRIEIKLIIIFSGNMWGEGLSHCGKRNPPGVGLHGVHRYLRIKYPSGIVGLWDISSMGHLVKGTNRLSLHSNTFEVSWLLS